MRITRQAERDSANVTTTTEQCPYVPGITRSGIRYRALSKGGKSGEFAIGRPLRPPSFEGSTWGWATHLHWTSDHGYWDEPDEAPEQPLHPDDE